MNPLFKKTSTGKITTTQYFINSDENGVFYYAVNGYIDGKKTITKPTYVKQKNIGKANETSLLAQVESEVKSKISKKKDSGYKDTIEEARADTVILPMLAHTYQKRGHDIILPAYGQRKFDGARCLAIYNSGKITLISRKGKEWLVCDKIKDELYGILNQENFILDGELYSDTIPFEKAIGLLRKKKLTSDELKMINIHIKFRVYDLINLVMPKMGFQSRYDLMLQLVEGKSDFVVPTENVIINKKSEIKPLHDKFVQEGYEGLIIRNITGEYGLNKRSKHLQKLKDFKEAEFKIIDFFEADGNHKGLIMFWCQDNEGRKFKVTPMGTHEDRKFWFLNGENFIGQMLTVKFFEYTEKGVPRHGNGKVIRDYE